ncbi:hypothetical protein K5549_021611, partial [Capra hircus]
AASRTRPRVPRSLSTRPLFEGLQKEPAEGFQVTLVDVGDLYNPEAAISGTPNTYHEGGYFQGWSSPPNGGTPPRASGPSLPAPSPAPRTQRLTRLCGHLRDAARRGCEPRQGQEHADTTSQQVQGTKAGAEPGGEHAPIQLTIFHTRSGGPGTRQASELFHREDWEAEAGNCFRVNMDDQGNEGSWRHVPRNRLTKFSPQNRR